MKQLALYTGGGVSLSPRSGEGRRVSNYVRLIAEDGCAITDGNVITSCTDTMNPEKWADCELPEQEDVL